MPSIASDSRANVRKLPATFYVGIRCNYGALCYVGAVQFACAVAKVPDEKCECRA